VPATAHPCRFSGANFWHPRGARAAPFPRAPAGTGRGRLGETGQEQSGYAPQADWLNPWKKGDHFGRERGRLGRWGARGSWLSPDHPVAIDRSIAQSEMDDPRAITWCDRRTYKHKYSALGAVRAFRLPAASSLCVLTQPRPSTEPAGASSGESRVVLHAMQLKAMAGCRQRWLYQQFRWSAVAHRRTKSLAACSRSCSPQFLGHLGGATAADPAAPSTLASSW